MLDTNAVSAIIKGPTERFRESMLAAAPSALCVSAITEGELRFGLAKRPEATGLAEAVKALLARLEILPWDSTAAQSYGPLRASLALAGHPLSPLDTLIAAHALAVGANLVTSDKAFARVEGLTVADWSA